jgi:cytochrome c-type biogenesis protein CcmH
MNSVRTKNSARRAGFAAIGLACALFAASAGFAADAPVDTHGQLRDPVLEARYESISKQLRCLVCQNESIADSNAQLAGDLRRQVREMLVAGKTDAEIFDFMTARYGEFVRFNTPLEGKTLLIWGSPFLLLVVGAIVVFRVTRARSRMSLDDEPSHGPA